MSPKKRHDFASEPLEPLIFTLRRQRVILDSDLARLYGVTTGRLNEAFKRNRQRFPEDFAFQLTVAEFANLRSQIVTSSARLADDQGDAANLSQIAIGSGPEVITICDHLPECAWRASRSQTVCLETAFNHLIT